MSRILFDMAEDIHPALTQEGKGTAVLVDVDSFQSLLEELELLRDVHRGLADVEAGRVVSHEEARARLMARYS